MATIEDVLEQLEKDIKCALFFAKSDVEFRLEIEKDLDIDDFYTSFETQLEVHLKKTQSLLQKLIDNAIEQKKKDVPYDWIRGVKNGKEEVKWFDSIEEAKKYFDEGSNLENLGNNFMKVFDYGGTEVVDSPKFFKLTNQQKISIYREQQKYLDFISKEYNYQIESKTAETNIHMIELGDWEGNSLNHYFQQLTKQSFTNIYFNRNKPKILKANMSTLKEYWELYGDTIIASAKRTAFFQVLGIFYKHSSVLSWLLTTSELGPSRSSFTERVIEKTKELNMFYNKTTYNHLNGQWFQEFLYERMKQRKPISASEYIENN